MYHVLKKHKRHLLAIFTAALMVAFLLPGRMGNSPEQRERGRIGDERLTAADFHNANQEHDLLLRSVLVKGPDGRGYPALYLLPQSALLEMHDHPDVYLLLQREAARLGAYVPPQRVEELFENCVVRLPNADDFRTQQFVKRALANLLMVQGAFRDAAGTIKVSQPYRDYLLASRTQKLTVTAVEFPATDFRNALPAPTEAQLKELFERHADVLPSPAGANDQSNPFGFAYKLPHRVKLQYLHIPYTEIRKSVEATRTPDEWEVEARKYYRRHPDAYSTTTRPAAGSTTGPATRSIKPFPEVRNEIMESLLGPEVERRQTEIQRYVNSVMPEDFAAFKAAGGSTRPSMLEASYGEYAYLQRLAAELQKRFRVSARVESFSGWHSREDLAKNESLAKVNAPGGVALNEYATLTAAEFERRQRREPSLPRPLEVLQPSQALHDTDRGLWYVRLTAIEPERRATGLDEVREQVERDWRLQESMRLASKAAEDFLGAATKQGFHMAAQAQKKLALRSDPFVHGGRVMGLHIDDAQAPQFTRQAVSLLAKRESGENPALAVIQLAQQGRVFAVRLDEVSSDLPPDFRSYLAASAAASMEQQLARQLEARWFSYANVVQRLAFKAASDETPPSQEEPLSPDEWPQL